MPLHTPAYPSYPWENPTKTLPLIMKTIVLAVYMWVLGGRGRGLAFHTYGLPLAHPTPLAPFVRSRSVSRLLVTRTFIPTANSTVHGKLLCRWQLSILLCIAIQYCSFNVALHLCTQSPALHMKSH